MAKMLWKGRSEPRNGDRGSMAPEFVDPPSVGVRFSGPEVKQGGLLSQTRPNKQSHPCFGSIPDGFASTVTSTFAPFLSFTSLPCSSVKVFSIRISL